MANIVIQNGSKTSIIGTVDVVASTPLPVDLSSNIFELDSSHIGAFGDLMTAELTPVFQTDAIYGLLTQQVSNTVSGTGATVDTNAGRYRIQSGTTATTGSAVLQSVYPFRYRAGQGILTRFTTVFQTGIIGNVQEIGIGNTIDKYCFGYNGTAYGILYRNNSSDTWIPQASWNGDICDGTGTSGFTIVPTNGNVCQVIYPFLGYGNIRFYIQNSATSRWILVHTIRYANSSTAIQISNPALGMWLRSANTGANTTNVTCYTGSFAAFVIGKKEYTAGAFGTDNLKTAVTTELNIISLRNATTFNGQINKAVVRIRSISFTADGGNGGSRLRVKKAVTLGGTPAFTTISGTTANNGVTITTGQSVCSQDTAGTTVTGGYTEFNTGAARNGNAFMDVTSFNLFLYPGETYTFSALSQDSTDIIVSINWDEDI